MFTSVSSSTQTRQSCYDYVRGLSASVCYSYIYRILLQSTPHLISCFSTKLFFVFVRPQSVLSAAREYIALSFILRGTNRKIIGITLIKSKLFFGFVLACCLMTDSSKSLSGFSRFSALFANSDYDVLNKWRSLMMKRIHYGLVSFTLITGLYSSHWERVFSNLCSL